MNQEFYLNPTLTEIEPSKFSSLYMEATKQTPAQLFQTLTAYSMYLSDNSINFSNKNGTICISKTGEAGEIPLFSKTYRGLFFY